MPFPADPSVVERFPHLVEDEVPLSRSILWKLQRHFYLSGGSLASWRDGIIPHYVTSNPFFAGACAEVIAGFVADCEAGDAGPIDPRHPIQIVELGSGNGRFAFHLLRQLRDGYHALGRKPPIRYVMTDLSDAVVASWREHPAFRLFLDEGLLDFAQFDVEARSGLVLRCSGEDLAARPTVNPIVLIANYVFDSLQQDAFWFEDHRPSEIRVALRSRAAERDLHDTDLFTRIGLDYRVRPIAGSYYRDDALDRLIAERAAVPGASCGVLPLAAIECCRFFHRLSGGRWALLSAEKGFLDCAPGREADLPTLVVHGQYVSLDVDYRFVDDFLRHQGGELLRPDHPATNILVVASLPDRTPGKFVAMRRAYRQAIRHFGPDEFFSLRSDLATAYSHLTMAGFLALIRLGRADSDLIADCLPAAMERVAVAAPEQREELAELLLEARACYFHLGEKPDFLFRLGVSLYGLGKIKEAIEVFHESLKWYGKDPNVIFNLAVCHYHLGERDAALDRARETVALDPTHQPARAMALELAPR